MRHSIILVAALLALSSVGCKGTDVDAGSYGLGGMNRSPSIGSTGGVDGAGDVGVGVDGSGGVDLDVDPDRVSIPASGGK